MFDHNSVRTIAILGIPFNEFLRKVFNLDRRMSHKFSYLSFCHKTTSRLPKSTLNYQLKCHNSWYFLHLLCYPNTTQCANTDHLSLILRRHRRRLLPQRRISRPKTNEWNGASNLVHSTSFVARGKPQRHMPEIFTFNRSFENAPKNTQILLKNEQNQRLFETSSKQSNKRVRMVVS